MHDEIERRYLLKWIPQKLKGKFTLIFQTYSSFENPEIRLRNEDGYYYQNIKHGQGLKRKESDPIPIKGDDFSRVWNQFPERQLVKQRYKHPAGNFVWELDEFLRRHKGLFIAEIELPSAEIIPEIPPELKEVIIREITDDDRYRNKNLSRYGIPQETP